MESLGMEELMKMAAMISIAGHHFLLHGIALGVKPQHLLPSPGGSGVIHLECNRRLKVDEA